MEEGGRNAISTPLLQFGVEQRANAVTQSGVTQLILAYASRPWFLGQYFGVVIPIEPEVGKQRLLWLG